MNEQEAFLAAIFSNPAADLPRLVYADWLDEHGDPDRAEFIRLQLRADPDSATQMRLLELMRANKSNWLGPLASRIDPGDMILVMNEYARGFVRCLDVASDRFQHPWIEELGRTLSLHPVEILRITGKSPTLDAVALTRQMVAWPHLKNVHTLEWEAGPETLPDDSSELLAFNPHLGSLRKFSLTPRLSTSGLANLEAGGLFDDLNSLFIHPIIEEMDDWFERFLQLPVLDRLHALDLSCGPYEDDRLDQALDRIANSRCVSLDLGDNSIRGPGLESLHYRSEFQRLRSLNLNENPLPAAEIARLLSSPVLAHLEQLSLAFNTGGGWGSADRQDVCVALTGLLKLKDLSIVYNDLTCDDVRVLSGGRFPHLEKLNLWGNPIGDEGAQFLSAVPWASSVKLWVRECGISDSGAKSLANSPFREIVLSRGSIGEECRRQILQKHGRQRVTIF